LPPVVRADKEVAHNQKKRQATTFPFELSVGRLNGFEKIIIDERKSV
jgi:hypothetical protein